MISSALIEKIKELVGLEHLLTGVDRAVYAVSGCTPDAVAFPGSVEAVSRLLSLASEEGISVTPWGGGTKIEIGAPPKKLRLVVGLQRLNRIIEHEPGDLTATAEAGMRLSEFQAQLARVGQWLSLDPPFPDRATLGGILSANASGPKRHLYGSARDLVIGLTVVAADGAVIRAGGKVVKNVAGYDLPKLYIGALGSLGIIVGVTVKLRPLPEDEQALLATFPALSQAASAARLLMASDLIPNAVELLNAELLRGLQSEGAAGAGLLVGFDGLARQVAWQLDEAEGIVAANGGRAARRLGGTAKEDAWQFVRELRARTFSEAAVQIKVGVLSSQLPTLFVEGEAIAKRNGQRVALAAHVGLGLLRAVFVPEQAAAGADGLIGSLTSWREMVRGRGGHLAVERAPLDVKEKISVWDPPGAAVRIMERLKAELDPKGIINPGRFVGGI